MLLALQVNYYFSATKGEGASDTSKCDLSVRLRVNRVRIVALYLFVARLLNYAQQLHTPQQYAEVFEPDDHQALKESQAVAQVCLSAIHYVNGYTLLSKTQESVPRPPMRIKLDISVQAPEVTVPLSSLSRDVVVLDLGQLTLTNEFSALDVGFSKKQSVALYEQHDVRLTQLQVYR